MANLDNSQNSPGGIGILAVEHGLEAHATTIAQRFDAVSVWRRG